LLISCAPAEVNRQTAISESAMKGFRWLLSLGFARVILGAGSSRLLFPDSFEWARLVYRMLRYGMKHVDHPGQKSVSQGQR